MGWQSRDWYLGGYKAQLFDSNGNAGPTVWVDGRIVGGWGHPESGRSLQGLLEDVGAEATRQIRGRGGEMDELAGRRTSDSALPVTTREDALPGLEAVPDQRSEVVRRECVAGSRGDLVAQVRGFEHQ